MGGSEPLMYLFQAHTEVMQMKGKSWAKPKYFLAKVTIGQMGELQTFYGNIRLLVSRYNV